MDNQIIYKEKQKTYFILIFAFILIAFFILAIIFFPGFFNKQQINFTSKMILLFATVVDLIMFWCFKELTIVITDKKISFGFGFFKKSIKMTDIKNAEVEEYKISNYLGYGIRFGRDKSMAFAGRGGRGVKIITNKNNYFFSTDNPEKIVLLLKQNLKLF